MDVRLLQNEHWNEDLLPQAPKNLNHPKGFQRYSGYPKGLPSAPEELKTTIFLITDERPLGLPKPWPATVRSVSPKPLSKNKSYAGPAVNYHKFAQ